MSYQDLKTEVVNIEVEFSLHENSLEGRDGYYSGVRPNHWIPGRDYAFFGQVEFHDRELLKPGESCRAVVKSMLASQDKPAIKPGFSWHVCEGNRIVGYATVV